MCVQGARVVCEGYNYSGNSESATQMRRRAKGSTKQHFLPCRFLLVQRSMDHAPHGVRYGPYP
jgi:hypothetical protein